MSLLNNVAALEKKVPYQTYTLKHGIESIKILVPLKAAQVFEEEFKGLTDRSKSAITLLVEKHNGKVKV